MPAPPANNPSTQITVSETGGVSLLVGGCATFATSDKTGPAVHRFTDTYQYFDGTTIGVDAPIGRPPVFSRGADRTDLRAIS